MNFYCKYGAIPKVDDDERENDSISISLPSLTPNSLYSDDDECKSLGLEIGLPSSYHSFPSPISGRSPSLPSFRVPKYGYYNIEGDISPLPSEPRPSPVSRSGYGTSASIRKSSIFHAFIQSINFFMGIGILGLPYAIHMTGWLGISLLIAFGVLMIYTGLLYGRTRRKFPLETFSDHIEFAFSTAGRVIISFVFYSSLLLNTSLYMLLLSSALTEMTSGMVGIAWTLLLSTIIFMILTLCVHGSTSMWTRWLSVVGTIATLILFVALVTAEILVLIEYEEYAMVDHPHARVRPAVPNDRVYYTNYKCWLKSIGIFGYCYMGHEIFPSIFHNMKHPTSYAPVVFTTFVFMIVSYVAVATMGYIVYGHHAHDNIMHNLPRHHLLTYLVQICIVLVSLTKLSLASAPLTEGYLEWTDLLCYLIRHSHYVSLLAGQATRPMPRLRIHPRNRSTYHTAAAATPPGPVRRNPPPRRRPAAAAGRVHRAHTLDSSQRHPTTTAATTAAAAAAANSGTMPSSSSSPSLIVGTHSTAAATTTVSASPSFGLFPESNFGDLTEDTCITLKQYREENEARAGEFKMGWDGQHTTRFESCAAVDADKDSKDPLSVDILPVVPRGLPPLGAGGQGTPRRELTWSDAIPIPPIRSTSCENMVLTVSNINTITSGIVGGSSGVGADADAGGERRTATLHTNHPSCADDSDFLNSITTIPDGSYDFQLGFNEENGATKLDMLDAHSSHKSSLTSDDGQSDSINPVELLIQDFAESVDVSRVHLPVRMLSATGTGTSTCTTAKVPAAADDSYLPAPLQVTGASAGASSESTGKLTSSESSGVSVEVGGTKHASIPNDEVEADVSERGTQQRREIVIDNTEIAKGKTAGGTCAGSSSSSGGGSGGGDFTLLLSPSEPNNNNETTCANSFIFQSTLGDESPTIDAVLGGQSGWQQSICPRMLLQVLPWCVRAAIPILSISIVLLFRCNFIALLIFIGGVYGTAVSVIIPAWSYYCIHYQHISTLETYVLHAVILTGLSIIALTVWALIVT